MEGLKGNTIHRHHLSLLKHTDVECLEGCRLITLLWLAAGAVTASSIQFQTNSAAFLAAVREIAGQETGLNVIDKATQVRGTRPHLSRICHICNRLRCQSFSEL